MRNIIIDFLVVLIIVLCYLGYKDYELYIYKPYKVDVSADSSLVIENSSQITNHTLENLNFYLDNTLYITEDYGDTYRQNNSQFIINEEVDATNSLVTENIDIESNIPNDDNTTIQFQVEHNIIQNICREDSLLGTVDYMDLMKYSKLNNEMDILHYYIQNKNQKLNLFNFLYQIRTLYLASTIVDKLEITGNITFLEGLSGYLLENNNETVVGLFNNGNFYQITFASGYEIDDISNLLNTIYFN